MGKKTGPKPWEPTAEQLAKIRLYAGLGSTQEQIATMVGKSVDSLWRNEAAYEAWQQGQAETIAKVAGTLVKKALAGDTASAIFYLKTRAGWKETERHEHTGADGGAIEVDQRTSDADAFTRSVAGLAARRGAGSSAGETEH